MRIRFRVGLICWFLLFVLRPAAKVDMVVVAHDWLKAHTQDCQLVSTQGASKPQNDPRSVVYP